jgi:hypothetical protein
MKKLILVAVIFLSFGLATNAQQANIDLFQNEMTATKIPASKINLNHSHFLSAKNVLQFTPAPEPVHNKDYYLKKSRDNRIASLCLVGGGFVIAGIGALTFPKDYDMIFENGSEKESQADASTALIIAGSAVMLSSIPFTVLASVYKRKANLMVTSQKTGFGVPANVSKDITGITLTIPIGK